MNYIYTACLFGISDVYRQYRKTFFGPLWVMLGVSLWVIAMSLVFGVLLKQDIKIFFPYVSIGMLCWMIISNVLNEGAQAYIVGEDLIRAVPISPNFHVIRVCSKNLFIGFHYLLLCFFIVLFSGYGIHPQAFFVIPGLMVSFLFLYEIICILSLYALKFRDIIPLIALSTQIIPLLTPIVWKSEMLGKYSNLVELNPFYHLINIMRAPILGEYPDKFSYLIILFLIVLLMPFAKISLKKAKSKAYFYL